MEKLLYCPKGYFFLSCSIFFFPKKAQLSLWIVQYLKKKIVLISLHFQLNNEVLLASFMSCRLYTVSAIHEKFALIFSLGQYKPLERKALTGIIILCLLDSSVWSRVRVEGCFPRCHCKHTSEILLHTSHFSKAGLLFTLSYYVCSAVRRFCITA